MPISFSIQAAADESGLSTRTLHAAIARGELRVLRVGRRVLIEPDELKDFLRRKSENSQMGAD